MNEAEVLGREFDVEIRMDTAREWRTEPAEEYIQHRIGFAKDTTDPALAAPRI